MCRFCKQLTTNMQVKCLPDHVWLTASVCLPRFVKFARPDEASAAIAKFNNFPIQQKYRLRVSIALNAEQKAQRAEQRKVSSPTPSAHGWRGLWHYLPRHYVTKIRFFWSFQRNSIFLPVDCYCYDPISWYHNICWSCAKITEQSNVSIGVGSSRL